MRCKFKSPYTGLISIIIISIIFGFFYYIYLVFTTGEWSEKNIAIWNEMHLVNRFYVKNILLEKNTLKKPMFFRKKINYAGKNYDLLAVPSIINNDPANPYIWIITNTHVDDDYSLPYRIYITPGYAGDKDSFYIKCDYLHKIEKEERFDPIVSQFMHKRCK